MKRISDLTEAQGIEIAKLAYAFRVGLPDEKSWIRSDIKFKYQPYDHEWYEDAHEFVQLTFDGITFGETVDHIRLWIHPNLNVNMDYYREGGGGSSLPICEQHAIFEKFREWDIYPSKELVPKYVKLNDIINDFDNVDFSKIHRDKINSLIDSLCKKEFETMTDIQIGNIYQFMKLVDEDILVMYLLLLIGKGDFKSNPKTIDFIKKFPETLAKLNLS